MRNGSFIRDWTAWQYEQRHRSISVANAEGTRALNRPKDPLLALWVSQRELLEQNAAQQQKLLSEFQAALSKSQTAWSDQAKTLAQQSLNAALQAAQKSTALLLEEAARVNTAAVRQAFQEGVTRMEQVVSAGQRIAWLSLAASVVALTAAICAIFVHVIR